MSFSAPERARLVELLEQAAAQERAVAKLSQATAAERELNRRDAELLQRLAKQLETS